MALTRGIRPVRDERCRRIFTVLWAEKMTIGSKLPKRCRFCRGRVSAEMTDLELKVGLAFHGISCIAAFAILLYMRRKAEEA